MDDHKSLCALHNVFLAVSPSVYRPVDMLIKALFVQPADLVSDAVLPRNGICLHFSRFSFLFCGPLLLSIADLVGLDAHFFVIDGEEGSRSMDGWSIGYYPCSPANWQRGSHIVSAE